MDSVDPVTGPDSSQSGSSSRLSALTRLWPGLLIAAIITGAASLIAHHTRVAGPLAWALLIGVAVAPLVRRIGADIEPGTGFASRTLLKVGVALLGLGISVGQAIALGPSGLVIAAAVIGGTLTLTILVGTRLGAGRDLTVLIGVGTAVCGASAIAATSAATGIRRSQVGYALATVTVIGTFAMLALPLLGPVIGLSDTGTAVWIGASIQEVAQVTAAGAAVSVGALKTATLVKLIRVVLLAAVLVAIRILYRRSPSPGARPEEGSRVSLLPPFILVFLLLMLIRSAAPLPEGLLGAAATASVLLQTGALAAIGLQVNLSELRDEGLRPVLLGFLSFVVAATIALAGVMLLV